MAYRSPQRIKKLNMDSGQDALGSIMQFLEMGVQNTKNEANQWLGQVDDVIGSLENAGTVDALSELDELVDNFWDEGEKFSKFFGEEIFDIQKFNLDQARTNQRGKINRYENSLNNMASLSYNPNAQFNFDRFLGDDGRMYQGEDFYKALQEWEVKRGGAESPIYWGDIDPSNMEVYMNFWANLMDNQNISEETRSRYSPLKILNQGFSQHQNFKDAMDGMGVSVDEWGNVSLPSMNLKRDFNVSWEENGEIKSREITLEEAIRKGFDNYNAYLLLTESLKNQIIYPSLYHLEVGPDGVPYKSKTSDTDYKFVTESEILTALNSTPSEFDNKAKDMYKIILQRVQGDVKSIASLNKFHKQIVDSINRVDKAQDKGLELANVLETMANYDAEDVNSLMGIDVNELAKTNMTRGELVNLSNNVVESINLHNTSIQDAKLRGFAWGISYDETTMPLGSGSFTSGLDETFSKDGEIINGGLTEEDKIKEISNENEEFLNNHVSVNDLRNLFNNESDYYEFLNFYAGSDDDSHVLTYYEEDKGRNEMPFLDALDENNDNVYFNRTVLNKVADIQVYNDLQDEIEDKLNEHDSGDAFPLKAIFTATVLDDITIPSSNPEYPLLAKQMLPFSKGAKLKVVDVLVNREHLDSKIAPPFSSYEDSDIPAVLYQPIDIDSIEYVFEYEYESHLGGKGKQVKAFIVNRNDLFDEDGNPIIGGIKDRIKIGGADFNLFTFDWDENKIKDMSNYPDNLYNFPIQNLNPTEASKKSAAIDKIKARYDKGEIDIEEFMDLRQNILNS